MNFKTITSGTQNTATGYTALNEIVNRPIKKGQIWQFQFTGTKEHHIGEIIDPYIRTSTGYRHRIKFVDSSYVFNVFSKELKYLIPKKIVLK